MKHIIIILLICKIGYSQNKQIEVDTISYSYKYEKKLNNELDLADLEKSKREFAFRFKNLGQVVEIIKDSTNISGSLTNYIYYKRKENREGKTLYKKQILSVKQAENIYNIIQNAEILELPSDNKIADWSFGAHGIPYIFEYSDKSTYFSKSYWSPNIQKVSEATKIEKFVKNICDTLNLVEEYEKFKSDLPKKSGQYYSGGSTITSYTYSTSYLGYSGATKLPFGFFAAHYRSYLGKEEVDLGGLVQYNFDANGFYHLSLRASKSVLFFKEEKLRDFAFYNYQNRKIDVKSINNHFHNHQLLYGLRFQNFGFGGGFDYLKDKTINKGGILIYASKYFQKLNLSTTASSSMFNDQINYKIDLERNFNLGDRSPIDNISLGLGYEDFMNYKDVYFMILTRF